MKYKRWCEQCNCLYSTDKKNSCKCSVCKKYNGDKLKRKRILGE